MWVELKSSRVPSLRDWLVQEVPSHWSSSMHSVNSVSPRFEPPVLKEGNKVKSYKPSVRTVPSMEEFRRMFCMMSD